jgi:hypothetical protein
MTKVAATWNVPATRRVADIHIAYLERLIRPFKSLGVGPLVCERLQHDTGAIGLSSFRAFATASSGL